MQARLGVEAPGPRVPGSLAFHRPRPAVNRTLYRKLWVSHVVRETGDGDALIYIDRQMLHEISSPQGFEGLRERGLRVGT